MTIFVVYIFVPFYFSPVRIQPSESKAVLYVDNNTINMKKRRKKKQKNLNEIYEKTHVRTTCNMHENDI